jgi:heme/copper-type cytochrome/quinol oxidase subunit 3
MLKQVPVKEAAVTGCTVVQHCGWNINGRGASGVCIKHHIGFEAAAWYCHFVDVVQ